MSHDLTILMSVYNGGKYLSESIHSMLNQTFSDFEFIIIDDASTDSSRDIIHSYNDPRIKLIKNEKHIGQAQSLNKGLVKAKGNYIARMDQDDISLPMRLECQLNVMEKNKNIGVCGTFALFIDNNGEIINLKYPEKLMTKNQDLKPQLLFKPCFIHPTVVIRLSLLKNHHIIFEKGGGHAQDYLMWFRLSSLTDFMNISDKLLKYRIHDEQLSTSKFNDQFISSINTRKRIIEKFLEREVSEDEKIKHSRISVAQHCSNLTEIDEAENWLQFLMNYNERNKKYETKSLTIVLENIWILLCMNSSHLGVMLLLKYFTSPLRYFKFANIYKEFKLILKCLIRYKVTLPIYRL